MRHPEAGELTKRVALYRWVETPQEDGYADRVLTLIGERWAKVEVVGAQMYWGTAQIEETVTHRIWLRYVPTVTDPLTLTGQVQVLYNGAMFRVKRVSDFNELHLWTLLEVEMLGTEDNAH